MLDFSYRCKNAIIVVLTQIHKHANSVFISRPKKGGWYQEMAIRYGLCQQPAVLLVRRKSEEA